MAHMHPLLAVSAIATLAQVTAPAQVDPQAIVDYLIGTWWPVAAAIATPLLAGIFTKEQAATYVKQGFVIACTVVFVALSIWADGFDNLTPEIVFARLALYGAGAEGAYRAIKATIGESPNRHTFPTFGIGRPTID